MADRLKCDIDPYEVLGVQRDADRNEIRKKFQEQARKCHPDKLSTVITPTEREASIERFHRLSHAYHMLSDDVTRQHHDIEQRAKKLTKELIINENILITEMEFDGNIYLHECRCGGVYIVRVEHVKESDHELIVACDTCSLHIKVIFK